MAHWKLPSGAVFHGAPVVRFREVIIFSHHFAGRQYNLHRHIKFVTALGFNAVSFDYSWHGKRAPKSFFLLPDFKSGRVDIGLKHHWSLEIERLMESIPEPRSLIIYGFSGPSASAIEAVARRQKHGIDDVRAMVFDSGPFVDPWVCVGNLLRLHYGIENPIKRKAILISTMAALGPRHAATLRNDVASLRKDLPILSIRGEDDPLVPPKQISDVFSNQGLRKLQILTIPGCGHLVGLRNFSDQYRPVVEKFLMETATPIAGKR